MWRTWRLLQGTVLSLAACSMAGSPVAEAAERPFTVREIASFSTPWAIDFLPGSGRPLTDTALVSERDGRLWLVNVANGTRTEVSGVPPVHVAGQGGLGDVVADPDFAGNRRIYLSFVEAAPDGTSGAALGYGTLDLRNGRGQLTGFKVIWRQNPKVEGDGHFAHRIAFSPDGYLFLTSGERQKFDPAQDLTGNLGKVLRLSKEGQPARGNPFADPNDDTNRDPAIWSYGHRNPLGIAFAPDGRLWESEMGPRGGDEINLIERGRNYGWPRASNGSHYDGRDIPDHRASDGFAPPKVWWNPSISPGGLMIYTGDRFAGWKGDALVPALSGQALIRVDLDGDQARKADQWDMGARIRAVKQGPDGRLFVLEDEGRLLELVKR